MARLPALLLLAILQPAPQALAMSDHNLSVCGLDTEMPHKSIPKPLEAAVAVQVRLKIGYLCSPKRKSVDTYKLLLLFMPGALPRPLGYRRVLTDLARRGFCRCVPRL